MPRTFDPARGIQSQLASMEDESPASLLGYYLTEFNLPVKVVAAAAGLSPLTLYQYVEAPEGVRPAMSTEACIKTIVDKLHLLAAQGKLDISGTPIERRDLLGALLMVEAAE